MIIGFICLALLCLIGWFLAIIGIAGCYKSDKENELLKERLKKLEKWEKLNTTIERVAQTIEENKKEDIENEWHSQAD